MPGNQDSHSFFALALITENAKEGRWSFAQLLGSLKARPLLLIRRSGDLLVSPFISSDLNLRGRLLVHLNGMCFLKPEIPSRCIRIVYPTLGEIEPVIERFLRDVVLPMPMRRPRN